MASDGVTFKNPSALAAPLGAYSHMSKGAGLVHVAGQVGVDESGGLVGPHVAAQGRTAYHNIRAILADEDLSMSAILRFTTYLIDEEDIGEFYNLREELFPELFPDGGYPPNTLLIVRRLVKPTFRIEIEAVAALSSS